MPRISLETILSRIVEPRARFDKTKRNTWRYLESLTKQRSVPDDRNYSEKKRKVYPPGICMVIHWSLTACSVTAIKTP